MQSESSSIFWRRFSIVDSSNFNCELGVNIPIKKSREHNYSKMLLNIKAHDLVLTW